MSSINIDFKNSDFRSEKARNSGAMKKLLGIESVAKVLDSEGARQKAYSSLQKFAKTGNKEEALKKTLYVLREEGCVSRKDAERMVKDLVRHGKRFIAPENEKRSHGLVGSSARLSELMEKRKQKQTAPSSEAQSPASASRIPLVGDNRMRSKLGGLSPSFGGASPRESSSSSSSRSARPGRR